MQPLAAPQTTNLTDAGEASNVVSAHSNKTSDVGFNDLMSAARASVEKRRVEQEELAAQRASKQAKNQTEAKKESENAVDALTAAAKFASHNVKLKRDAADAESRSAPDKKAATERSGDVQPDAQPGAETRSTAKSSRDDTSHNGTLSEPSSVDLQPKAASTINVQGDTEQNKSTVLTDQEPTPTTVEFSLPHEIKPVPAINPSELEPVADLPAEFMAHPQKLFSHLQNELALKADQENKDGSNGDVTAAPHARELAALTDSAQATLSTVLKAEVEPNKDVSLSQNQSPIIAGLENTVTENDGSEEAAVTVEPHSSVTDPQQAEINNVAGLTATPTTLNAAAAPVEQDPLLTPGRRQNLEQPIYQNRASVSTQVPNQGGGNVTSTAPELRIDQEQPLAGQSTSKETDHASVYKFEINSKSGSEQASDAPTNSFDDTSANNGDTAQQQQQMTDKRSTLVQQLKAATEEVSATQKLSQEKNAVSIQELAKIGVSEATVSISPSNLVGTEPQEQTISPTPLATATVQPPVSTGEAGASNSASNLERRTIAADIRLRALERMVVAAARAGTESITLQLYPPALGQVMIRLVMDGQKLRIMTRAANAEAVDALKDMEGDLRHALAGNGLDLAAFDVTDEKQDGDQDRRQKPADSTARSSGPNSESFTIDLNA